jgi:hypothetical protein
MDVCDKSRSLTGFKTCFSAVCPKALATNIFIKAMHFVSCFRSMMFIHSELRFVFSLSRVRTKMLCVKLVREGMDGSRIKQALL